MDEERILRDVLAQPEAPHPDAVADARAKLDRLTRTEVRKTRTNHARLAITALVAAFGVVGASLVPQLIRAQDDVPDIAPAQSAPAPAPTSPTSPRPLPSAQELLAKGATSQAQRSNQAGAFWRLRTLATSPVLVEAKKPYTMEFRAITEYWAGENAYAASGLLALSMRPASPADSRAYEQNGRPVKVRVQLTDGKKPTPYLGVTLPDKGRLDDDTLGYFGTVSLGGNLLQKLPTDPKGLVGVLLKQHYQTVSEDPDSWLFTTLSEILVATPAKPAVRATALKALSDLPGVAAIGLTEDVQGRTAIAIEREGDRHRTQLLLDPNTGQVLGLQKANGPRIAVLEAAWINEKPRPPAPVK